MAQTVALHRSRDDAAVRALVLSGRGARDMTTLRTVLDQLRDREHDQLERHLAASARHARTAREVLAGGTELAVLLVTASGVLVIQRITVPVRRVTDRRAAGQHGWARRAAAAQRPA